MKVLFHTSSLGKGGAERVISVLANKLVNKYEIDILVNRRVENEYKIDNRVQILTLDNDEENANDLLRNIKRIKQMKKIIEIEKPSIIISFLPMPSYRVLILKNKTLKIPVIVSDRNDPNQEYKFIINKLLMKILYKKADGFVFQTKQQANYFSKDIRSKSVIIFNPIKNEFLNSKKAVKEKTIINIGRLVEQKNQKMLINAFAKISSYNEQYKLKIFGDGPLKEILQKQIEDLNMKNRIELCGISNEIKEELEKAKIFVLSSNYEGMPNALIEAMAVGLPVIATDCPCGGPSELIENSKNGILISVNNEDELILQMTKLLKDDEYSERLGNNAKKIIDNLNEDKIVKQWEEYIEMICKKVSNS